MHGTARSEPDEESPSLGSESSAVTALESAPGKLVFIEQENTDGWIATDHVVEPWQ